MSKTFILKFTDKFYQDSRTLNGFRENINKKIKFRIIYFIKLNFKRRHIMYSLMKNSEKNNNFFLSNSINQIFDVLFKLLVYSHWIIIFIPPLLILSITFNIIIVVAKLININLNLVID